MNSIVRGLMHVWVFQMSEVTGFNATEAEEHQASSSQEEVVNEVRAGFNAIMAEVHQAESIQSEAHEVEAEWDEIMEDAGLEPQSREIRHPEALSDEELLDILVGDHMQAEDGIEGDLSMSEDGELMNYTAETLSEEELEAEAREAEEIQTDESQSDEDEDEAMSEEDEVEGEVQEILPQENRVSLRQIAQDILQRGMREIDLLRAVSEDAYRMAARRAINQGIFDSLEWLPIEQVGSLGAWLERISEIDLVTLQRCPHCLRYHDPCEFMHEEQDEE